MFAVAPDIVTPTYMIDAALINVLMSRICKLASPDDDNTENDSPQPAYVLDVADVADAGDRNCP